MKGRKRKHGGKAINKWPNHFQPLDTMRENGEMCDFTIEVGEKTYAVHRAVLAAAIRSFNKKSTLKTAVENEDEKSVKLENISPKSIEMIIKYAYTGMIKWDGEEELTQFSNDGIDLGMKKLVESVRKSQGIHPKTQDTAGCSEDSEDESSERTSGKRQRYLDANEDANVYKHTAHFQSLKNLQTKDIFCDVTIKTPIKILENGKKMKWKTHHAHKVVLAATIPFFGTLFTTDVGHKGKEVISISHVSAKDMEDIIKFAYSGKIKWSELDDLLRFIKNADCFEMLSVKDEGIKVLASQLTTNNAAQAYYLSHNFMSSLLKKESGQFILNNLKDVAKTEEFLKLLDFASIKDILSRDPFACYNAEQRVKPILKWIEFDFQKRNLHTTELFASLQLGHACANSEKIIQIIDKEDYFFKSTKKKDQKSRSQRYKYELEQQRSLVENLQSGIVIFPRYDSKKFEVYNPVSGRWTEMEGTHYKRWNFGVTVCGDKLFIIGGEKANEKTWRTQKGDITGRTETFNFATREIEEKSYMEQIRRSMGIISVNNQIFVCGGDYLSSNEGRHRNSKLSSVEKYSMETNKWSWVCPMGINRAQFSVVALGKYLYAIGGTSTNSNRSLNTMEKYDIDNNQWEDLSSTLNLGRAYCEAAVLNGKIYVCGGRNGEVYLNSVEMYDPATDSWDYVASMRERRTSFFLTAHEGKLWAFGGYNGRATVATVETYDPENDVWSNSSPMKTPGTVSGCVFPNKI